MNQNLKRLFFILIVAALAIGACASKARSTSPYRLEPAIGGAPPYAQQEAPGMPAPTMMAPASDAAKAAGGNQPGSVAEGPAPSTTDRLVIQNADLTIVVKDVKARAEDIQKMAAQMGGYLVSANLYQTYAANGTQVLQAQVVIRVPSDKLQEALDTIKKDTVDVQNENRSGQDVTDQYVDLQSRLRAKQAAEAQLTKIMESAEKTEDVLAVYAQLQQVQSDIEVLKGQIKYYEESAHFSAISVNVVAEETIQPLKVGPWTPQGTARDAIQSLIFFWQDFVDWLIRFFLYTVPVLITVGIPLFLAFLFLRWIFRMIWKPKAKAVQPEEGKK